MQATPAHTSAALLLSLLAAVGGSALPAGAATSAAKAGAVCTKAGAVSGALTCTKKAGRLVWAKAAATAASTTAPGAAAATAGIAGVWKASAASQAGYRVKEKLNGQSTEAVGRTNAVTGTLTIAGTTVTAADITIDVTKLASDESRRDSQVQGRILQTSQFPAAKVKLAAPIALGKVPADKEQVVSKAKVALTLKGTTKTVDVTLTSRRNGADIEVQGSIPVVFADYAIANPSFGGFVQTEDNGLIEFVLVFTR